MGLGPVAEPLGEGLQCQPVSTREGLSGMVQFFHVVVEV